MDSVYSAVLIIHSWLRWAALLLGVAATFNAFRHRGGPAGRPKGQRWDTFFMLTVDLQVLCGLLMYFGLSPFTRAAMNNVGLAVRDPGLRFWAITHIALMFVAVVALRVGRVLALNGKTPHARGNGRWICFGIAVLAMLAGVPWPGLGEGRPLFRF